MKVKVLFIRFSSIGDIVLTTPIIRCFKNQVDGDAEIHYLVKQQYKSLLSANPYIDQLHTLEDRLSDVISKLKEEHFDYVFDLHKNLRSSIVKRNLKVLSFSFDKLNVKKWLYVNLGVNLLPKIHLVDRYFEVVSAFGITNDQKGLDFYISEEEKVNIFTTYPELKDGFIAFNIGGKYSGKKLPTNKIITICQHLDASVLLLGGKEDIEIGEEIAQACNNVTSACGKHSIVQSASLLIESTLVISHDTGFMHIAAAFKKIILSIWGATVPEFGMSPYLPDKRSKIFEADHLSFRPTSKLGNKNSPKERRTMEEIDENKIIESANRLYREVTNP